MTYAEAMKRLEEIVAALEAGGTDLDETLKLFEEGSNLLKECQKELSEAEGKIETLRLEDVEGAKKSQPCKERLLGSLLIGETLMMKRFGPRGTL